MAKPTFDFGVLAAAIQPAIDQTYDAGTTDGTATGRAAQALADVAPLKTMADQLVAAAQAAVDAANAAAKKLADEAAALTAPPSP